LSPRELSLAGWRSRLALVVTAGLGFLGLSGLWNYLAPFSVFSQLLLLVHVGVGLAISVLGSVYLFSHLATWIRQRATAAMFLGYALLVAFVVGVVSGLVVTGQGLVSLRLSPTWDYVHLIAGLTVLGLMLSHVVAAVVRRLPSARAEVEMAVAMKGFVRRLGLAVPVAAVVALVLAPLMPKPPGTFEVPADYGLPEYSQEFEEYRGNPFAPTYARTANLDMVEPELLAGSASCGRGGCHEQIYDEWAPSAHRFAAMNPPFQEVQLRFAADREPAETRYCAGCHDPISLFAGAKDIGHQSLSAPGVDEGLSCVACHSISSVDERGNADYELTPPRRYLGEASERPWSLLGDFLLRVYPRQHLADYDRNLLRTPEFCAACHKQFIPEALNRFGLVEGQNQYDEWKNGHWHSDDPETDLACRDCHMRLVESSDPGHGEAGDRRRSHDDGSHRHHGFIATNNFMPEVLKLPGWQRHVELTEEWVRGETDLPELGDLWPSGPVAGLALLAPERASPGDEIELRAVITNRKAGHNFITGPLDFVRSWVHLRVEDAAGNVLAEWGALDEQTRRILDRPGEEHRLGADGALVLESIPVDEDGNELRRHELWKKAGGKGRRVVFPQYSDSQAFRFRVDPGVEGPLRVSADLNYRRYRQEFLDLVVPDLESSTGVLQPTVTQASAEAVVVLGAADVAAGGGPRRNAGGGPRQNAGGGPRQNVGGGPRRNAGGGE
jgi:hypothetical protein